MQKINPAWIRHNNLFNEGGYGYNPHPKYIEVADKPARPAPSASGKIYRDSRGMPIDVAAAIADCEARLLIIKDPFARRSTEESLSNYRKMLEG